jgi:hypothetical protein
MAWDLRALDDKLKKKQQKIRRIYLDWICE